MTNDECSKYIKNYLENDKTRSAIMLTAPWGSGKSYYIQNTLIPDINKENGNKCVCISLYGIKRLEDISKALYLEIRAPKLTAKTESSSSAKIIGKTIMKGVSSFFGINLDVSGDDLQKLYESIDLSGKLIILEDIERCSIDIIEVLGYVNNLVEQDGVKVLLVANEDEFIRRETPRLDDVTEQKRSDFVLKYTNKEYQFTKETEGYLRKKEKTISDTIVYKYPKTESLRSIIGEFFSDDLSRLLTEDNVINDIINVMETVGTQNLRAVMYACQKTSDMISLYGKTINEDFVKFLLCSVIAYSCRLKKGEECRWKNAENSPMELGTAAFPLYKVCYDYLKEQRFNGNLLKQAEQNYIKRKQVENLKTEFNRYMDILRYFYNSTEQNVSDAIVHIKDLLLKKSVEYIQYGTLAYYLILVKDCVNDVSNIEDCKKTMLENIHDVSYNEEIEQGISYYSGNEFEDIDKEQELSSFKKSLNKELHYKKQAALMFDNTINWVDNFVKCVKNNQTDYLNDRSFAKNIDIEKFIEGIKKCSSSDIAQIRSAFLSVYSSANIGEFLSDDRETLINLKDILEKDCLKFADFDKIQKKQVQWFISNLEGIIQKL